MNDKDLEDLRKDLQILSIEDVLKKYGIGFKDLFDLSKQIDDEEKYISFSSGDMYFVSKTINGMSVYFGSYRDKDEAIKVRDELIKNKWDKEKLPEILDRLDIKSKCGDD